MYKKISIQANNIFVKKSSVIILKYKAPMSTKGNMKIPKTFKETKKKSQNYH